MTVCLTSLLAQLIAGRALAEARDIAWWRFFVSRFSCASQAARMSAGGAGCTAGVIHNLVKRARHQAWRCHRGRCGRVEGGISIFEELAVGPWLARSPMWCTATATSASTIRPKAGLRAGRMTTKANSPAEVASAPVFGGTDCSSPKNAGVRHSARRPARQSRIPKRTRGDGYPRLGEMCD